MIRIKCKDQELFPIGTNRRLCFGKVDLPVPGGPEGVLVEDDKFSEGEMKAIKADEHLVVESFKDKNENGVPDSEEKKRKK